jgi:hypothetical protein
MAAEVNGQVAGVADAAHTRIHNQPFMTTVRRLVPEQVSCNAAT